jgi:hypothetical protein
MKCPKCKRRMSRANIEMKDYREANGNCGPVFADFVCEDCLIYKQVKLMEIK